MLALFTRLFTIRPHVSHITNNSEVKENTMDEILSYNLRPDGYQIIIRQDDGKLLILTPASAQVSDDNQEKYVCALGVANGFRNPDQVWVI